MRLNHLSTVGRRVDSAGALLNAPPRPGQSDAVVIRDTLRVLGAVDDLLETLVHDASVDPATAARLGEVRDELAGHVLAAGAMADVELSPAKVADVLRRGMAAAKMAVSELDPDLRQPPFR